MVSFVDPVESRQVHDAVHPVETELPHYHKKAYLPKHGRDVGNALQIHLKLEIYQGIGDSDKWTNNKDIHTIDLHHKRYTLIDLHNI
jgi:hypothetical protein